MRTLCIPWLIGIALVSVLGRPSPGIPPEAAPPLEAPLEAPRDEVVPLATLPEIRVGANVERLAIQTDRPLHEVFLPPNQVREPIHIDKVPPKPILERPGIDAPNPRAQWIEGYWDWDAGHQDFVWVTGTWRDPPAGQFWVNGYWKRDAQGWSRIPGFWSQRQDTRTDWRTLGPPADHPEEVIAPAPGPDYFFIPGEHVPTGDGLAWRPGFWTKSQPGWEWLPARWIRLPDGWTFKEGRWERLGANVRRDAARPAFESMNAKPATAPQPIPDASPTGPPGRLESLPDDRQARNPGPARGANNAGGEEGTTIPPPSTGSSNGSRIPSPNPPAMGGGNLPLRPGMRIYVPGGPPGGYVVGPDGRLVAPANSAASKGRGGPNVPLGGLRQRVRGFLGGRR